MDSCISQRIFLEMSSPIGESPVVSTHVSLCTPRFTFEHSFATIPLLALFTCTEILFLRDFTVHVLNDSRKYCMSDKEFGFQARLFSSEPDYKRGWIKKNWTTIATEAVRLCVCEDFERKMERKEHTLNALS